MKKIIGLLAAVVIVCAMQTTTWAQARFKAEQPSDFIMPIKKGKYLTDRMTNVLFLTPEQFKEVQKVNVKRYRVLQQAPLTTRYQNMDAARVEEIKIKGERIYDNALKAILSSSQFDTYLSRKQSMLTDVDNQFGG